MSAKHLAKGSRQPISQSRGKLRLYSMRFCPYSQRVHLVLDAKQIPHDVVNINLTHKPDWFLDKSPLGKVPALEIEDGEVLIESLIICDYLDEKYPQTRLYPKDPLKKAKDRVLIEQFNKVITVMYKLFLTNGHACLEDYEDVIIDGLNTFEQELRSRRSRFFGGADPGMLDYMIWPWCERADLLKTLAGNHFILKKDKFIRLMEWRQNMREDPAIKPSLLDITLHAKYFQSRRAGVPDYDLALSSHH